MISQYHSAGSRNYGEFRDAELDSMLDGGLKELNYEVRKELLERFQTRWIEDWRRMYVMHANAARYSVQPNLGGWHTTAGTWFGYSWYTKIGRWFYVEK
jgi:ABC-type transport system substrate-binding protein